MNPRPNASFFRLCDLFFIVCPRLKWSHSSEFIRNWMLALSDITVAQNGFCWKPFLQITRKRTGFGPQESESIRVGHKSNRFSLKIIAMRSNRFDDACGAVSGQLCCRSYLHGYRRGSVSHSLSLYLMELPFKTTESACVKCINCKKQNRVHAHSRGIKAMALPAKEIRRLRRVMAMLEALIAESDKPKLGRPAIKTNRVLGQGKRIRRTGRELAAFRKKLRAERNSGIPYLNWLRSTGLRLRIFINWADEGCLLRSCLVPQRPFEAPRCPVFPERDLEPLVSCPEAWCRGGFSRLQARLHFRINGLQH